MIRDIPLFSGLDEEQISLLEHAVIRKKIPKNTVVVLQDDTTDSMYIIESGSVRVMMNDEEGREITLAILGQGEYFGEMAVVDSRPRSATVMTREPSVLLVIPGTAIQRLIREDSDFAPALLAGLLQRLRAADEQIASLVFRDVYGRMARLFNQMGREVDGRLVIHERLTHQDIANMVGASREMVSRIMKELVSGGYISVKNKRIRVERKLPYQW